jgi:hypothetical protein
VNRKTVRLWRERFNTQGLQGLWEIAPGRGRKATYDAARIKVVIGATLQSKPKGSTQWSFPDDGGRSGHQQIDGKQYLAQP